MHVLRTQAETECQGLGNGEIALHIRGHADTAYFEVIVQTLWSGFDEKIGSFRWPELGLRQVYIAPLNVDTGNGRMPICSNRHCADDARAYVTVFLERLTGEKMLQERHVGMAQEGSDVDGVSRYRSGPGAVEPLTGRLPERFRIGIAAVHRRVAVGVLADYEARGLLVEVGGGKGRGQLAAEKIIRRVYVQLELPVA